MKTPYTLEQARAIIRKQSGEDHKALSKKTGIPYSTIRKFAYGVTVSPRYSTYVALVKGLKA